MILGLNQSIKKGRSSIALRANTSLGRRQRRQAGGGLDRFTTFQTRQTDPRQTPPRQTGPRQIASSRQPRRGNNTIMKLSPNINPSRRTTQQSNNFRHAQSNNRQRPPIINNPVVNQIKIVAELDHVPSPLLAQRTEGRGGRFTHGIDGNNFSMFICDLCINWCPWLLLSLLLLYFCLKGPIFLCDCRPEKAPSCHNDFE